MKCVIKWQNTSPGNYRIWNSWKSRWQLVWCMVSFTYHVIVYLRLVVKCNRWRQQVNESWVIPYINITLGVVVQVHDQNSSFRFFFFAFPTHKKKNDLRWVDRHLIVYVFLMFCHYFGPNKGWFYRLPQYSPGDKGGEECVFMAGSSLTLNLSPAVPKHASWK